MATGGEPGHFGQAALHTALYRRFPEFSVNVPEIFEDVPIERPVLLTPPGGHGSLTSLVSAMVYRPAFP